MASTILVNSIKPQSGVDVNIPTGFKLKVADAGELYIGGTAITTGAQGVISKTAAYTILAADFTGKSSLIVFVNVSAGTSTETIITLPAAADFSTCAIHVVSTTAHGAGNSVAIKNSSAVEQYTLYKKGDHCEFVSDATDVFRTGNEFTTIFTLLAMTAADASAGQAYLRAYTSNYATQVNLGSSWHDTNDEWTAPFDGTIIVLHDCKSNTGSSGGNPVLYRDIGSGFVIFAGTNINGGGAQNRCASWTFDVTAGHVLRPYYFNNTTSAEGLNGNAAGTASMISFWYLRRD
jgi:hypothetical protein